MYYHRLGNIPPKRHTQFPQPDGGLYKEELVSSRGFSGIYSNLYHINAPTRVKSVGQSESYDSPIVKNYGLKHSHLNTSEIGVTGTDFLNARLPLLKNADVTLSLCNPQSESMDYFYKNAEGDEVIYIHEGSGYLLSQFGKLRINKGDYVIIPRTVIFQLQWDQAPVRLLIIESAGPVETPTRYRNELGQLLEHAPFCERDIRPPSELITQKEQGEYLVKIKKHGQLHHYHYSHSPFDLVGWDGYLWPYAFSIYEFEPITGRIHQPPPVHQTFQAQNFVICSFVPRLFDYHPLSIPAPYNHSNIDSDEVLFYAEGDFMSRKGISRGSFTLHPGGIPHGPHPGTVEKSIGAKETKEYAVMVDTFNPLYLTEHALEYLDANYPMSWTE
ncbi:homogentisate 1,2-dioxygenase [Fulvivirga sediminis]|uniref:Homogentisate 1,2-dioxygenase n=1 Tax=Fulvivirga sediminis TaxID=2803949 RepID=A0A937FA42_9BACT|nr:homogentisate 1,2-dioxygenase [Fulvivirga sediminis]MBL3657079.1 homogentisate 1,2-dioxygenase [Fulvivirga sediminis]